MSPIDIKRDRRDTTQINCYGNYLANIFFIYYIMKFEDFTVADLKKHAKGAVKGYTTMKKADLVKHLKKQFSIKGGAIVRKPLGSDPATYTPKPAPSGRESVGGRCWDGYEPVKGKKPFTNGS